MIIAIILILFAVALFLILHDDHDDSYTRSENKTVRKVPKSSYQKKAAKRPANLMEPRTVVPQEKQFQPHRVVNADPRKVSLAFLDRIQYDKSLPELTMSSFIAGLQGTSHIHNWVLFLLWLHPFILSGVISPLISSSIVGTY